MDSDEDLNATLELPSEEGEVFSSFQLSPDSTFCPSSVSGLSSAPRTPRGKSSPYSRGSPRGRARGSFAIGGRGRGRGTGTSRRVFADGADGTDTSHKCDVCQRKIKTAKGLEKHLFNHKLEERARRRPSATLLQDKCQEISSRIVEGLKSAPIADSTSGADFASFVEKISNKLEDIKFTDFVKVVVQPLIEVFSSSARIILPATIKQEVRRALHGSLADKAVHQSRLLSLRAVVEFHEETVADLFFAEFCRRLIDPVSGSIIGLMRDAPNDPHQISVSAFTQDFDTLFNQQILHRVSGYSLKAVLVKARQYKQSERWRKFKEVVLGRLATQGIANPNPHSKDYWTALLSRKSLMFVNDRTLNFFIEVAKVMCYTEAPDGILSKSKVLANVTSSPGILALWGILVGDVLDEQNSMYLMRVLVLSLCGTFGKGIMLRRMNQAASDNRARVSGVGLRGRLCR